MKNFPLLAFLFVIACGDSPTLNADTGITTDAGMLSDVGNAPDANDSGPFSFDAGAIPSCPDESEAREVASAEDFFALIPDTTDIEVEYAASRWLTTGDQIVSEEFLVSFDDLPAPHECRGVDECEFQPFSDVAGIEANMSARTLTFTMGARFRLRLGRFYRAPLYQDLWSLGLMSGCVQECPTGERLCPRDLVCYSDDARYCDHCSDPHPAVCECTGEAQRPLPDGSDCAWAPDGEDLLRGGMCVAGRCDGESL